MAYQIEQMNSLLKDVGVAPTTAIDDQGYRGVDREVAPVHVIHRGKHKTLTAQQRRWLKRRQTIEPMIGHTKSDNRIDCCWQSVTRSMR